MIVYIQYNGIATNSDDDDDEKKKPHAFRYMYNIYVHTKPYDIDRVYLFLFFIIFLLFFYFRHFFVSILIVTIDSRLFM